jgi:hypothetical protein
MNQQNISTANLNTMVQVVLKCKTIDFSKVPKNFAIQHVRKMCVGLDTASIEAVLKNVFPN